MSLAIRNTNAQVMEQVVIGGDLSKLTPEQKLSHYESVCSSLKLNPKTRPFAYIKMNGKEVLYALKDCTEQLRKIHKVSLKITDNKILEGVYIVTAFAQMPDGRIDSSTGAVTISGLKGDALCNAMLKAETKAKRRVTLSICGLGMTDESEIETIKGAVKINVIETPKLEDINDDDMDFNADLERISKCETIDQLKDVFNTLTTYWRDKKDLLKVSKIVELKDKRKSEIEAMSFNEEIDNAS